MLDFDTDIQYLKGVGAVRKEKYNRLNVRTVGDLLYYCPRLYEDWSSTVSIFDAPEAETCCIKATVVTPVTKSEVRGGMTVYKCSVSDGVNIMGITIFNSVFSADKLHEGEEYLFYGKVHTAFYRREMTNPQIVAAVTGERIRPVYSQTYGLSSAVIEKCVQNALAAIGDNVPEILPDSVRQSNGLLGIAKALRSVHFPAVKEDVDSGRRRLCFEELYVLQVGMMLMKGRNRKKTACVMQTDCTPEFVSSLPFTPTGAQRRAIREAVNDMKRSVPMARLLQGDVGSGKTMVAAALCYNCVKNGYQAAVMAPTEILANQHFDTFSRFLEGTGVKIELLTGSLSPKKKEALKGRLAGGETDLCIGTHALIQKDVEFSSLGLVVTDEQHRFGVGQRSTLGGKGKNPHVFVMSATPIPRTLALIIYGDLDISVLDEMPEGRQTIETYSVDTSLRKRAYAYIRKHLDAGRQGYLVCPAVEDSDIPDLTAAKTMAEELAQGEFSGYRVGLLHGKMKAKEKEKVMTAFSNGEIQLLVSTTVVEVGVDVPNAVIMVIENADRFGLSQLHQLRGRVGRGEDKSTCILISDNKSETASKRLKTMCTLTDGFKIADEDLKLRGPGDFFGARQHGLPELRFADLTEDMEILRCAQRAAKETVEKDYALRQPENRDLKKAVLRLFESIGPGGMN